MKNSDYALTAEDTERLLSAIPAHFCKTTADGYFLWLSPGWADLLGIPVEAIKSRPFLEYVHPDDRDRTRAAMRRLDEGHTVVNFSNRYVSREGRYVWLSWFARAHDDYYYAVATEQDDSRDRRAQLSESLHLLELTEELGQIGHWRVDLVANTLHWSDQVFRIHGLDPAVYEPELASAIDAYHPDDRSTVQAHIETAIARKEGFQFELRLIRADGQVRDVVSRGRVECDEQGEVTSLIGIFQDVTDWKRLERRLQESERLHSLSTLAAGVAHEINNPLQYITTSLEVALVDLENSSLPKSVTAGLTELLTDAEKGVAQVAQIVTQLRSFVQRDATAEGERVDLRSVLQTTISMTRNELRHRVEFSTRIEDMPTVRGRYTELVQVFVNLVTNAHQALSRSHVERGAIRLTGLTRSDGWAVVEVEDNGPGIRERDRAHIFEPFYTTKAVGEGTGLGLYVTRGIVQRHGGTISVTSDPGRTCFQVVLPPSEEVREDEKQVHSLPTILVVDDEVAVLDALGRMLARTFHVVAESSPEAALARVRSGQVFDVVLLDAQMPGLGGLELLSAMEEHAHGIARRAVLMTGALGSDAAPGRFPDVPVLAKPFKRATLEKLLSERTSGGG